MTSESLLNVPAWLTDQTQPVIDRSVGSAGLWADASYRRSHRTARERSVTRLDFHPSLWLIVRRCALYGRMTPWTMHCPGHDSRAVELVQAVGGKGLNGYADTNTHAPNTTRPRRQTRKKNPAVFRESPGLRACLGSSIRTHSIASMLPADTHAPNQFPYSQLQLLSIRE